MASESLAEKKQALALAIAQKREEIKARAGLLKSVASPKILTQPGAVQAEAHKSALPPRKLTNPGAGLSLSRASTKLGTIQRLPKTVEVLAHSRPKSLLVAGSALGFITAKTLKSLLSFRKRKAKEVPIKAAKMGASLLLLKWALGVSQPLAKHYIGKQIKRQLKRQFGA